ILAIAGPGAQRLASVIPTVFPGSLDPRDAVKTDREKARQLLRDANLGPVTGALSYSTDRTLGGVSRALVAQKVQAGLTQGGITTTLNGLPQNVATHQNRAGKPAFGLAAGPPDCPDAKNFLLFAPGRVLGRRAGWPADWNAEAKEITALAQDAETE